MGTRYPWAAIVLGGIVAGTIDIAAACLINSRSIGFVLQTIAGGMLGERTYEGGLATAVLGLLLQEAMGMFIAAIYLRIMHSAIGRMRRWRWAESGAIFAIGIFLVMNYVVLPLSAWHAVPRFTPYTLVANLGAMLLFGLIVAYFARSVAVEVPSEIAER